MADKERLEKVQHARRSAAKMLEGVETAYILAMLAACAEVLTARTGNEYAAAEIRDLAASVHNPGRAN